MLQTEQKLKSQYKSYTEVMPRRQALALLALKRIMNMLFQSSQAEKIPFFLTHLFLRKLVEGGPAKPGGLVHEKIRPSTHYYLIQSKRDNLISALYFSCFLPSVL